MNDLICQEHSGCTADIENIKKTNTAQWEEINSMGDKIDNIMTRLNVILGGIAIAVLMLLLNIVIKTV